MNFCMPGLTSVAEEFPAPLGARALHRRLLCRARQPPLSLPSSSFALPLHFAECVRHLSTAAEFPKKGHLSDGGALLPSNEATSPSGVACTFVTLVFR